MLMLGAGGLYRGSTVMLSGTAGTGKTSLASALARATSERGERVLYFAFEESAEQIIRNMNSIGIDLRPHSRERITQDHGAASVPAWPRNASGRDA